MTKKIVINDTEHETRVALLEDETIVELFIERQDNSDITGNIYKGRVQRVLPGMQAAFIDIGFKQAAFLYVDDVIGDHFKNTEKRPESPPADSDTGSDVDNDSKLFKRNDFSIEDLITEGQEILVQVAKSPLGTKGARVTSYTSLPGRFLVLVPTSDHVGVSRRIVDEPERIRLKNMVNALRKNKLGYIVRTAGEGIHEAKLAEEMDFLSNLWNSIQKKYPSAPVPLCCIRN